MLYKKKKLKICTAANNNYIYITYTYTLYVEKLGEEAKPCIEYILHNRYVCFKKESRKKCVTKHIYNILNI